MAAENGKILETIISIGGKLDPSVSAAINKAEVQLKHFSEGFTAMGKKALLAGTAIAAGITAGVTAAGAKLYKLGEDFDAVNNTIRTGTGATGEALDSLNASFDAVYSSVSAAKPAVAKAIADINTITSSTGKDLETFATAALNASKLMGEDVSAVYTSAAHAFNAFGVSQTQAAEKMDVLFKLSQATGASMAELAESARSNASTFAALGVDFDRAAVVMGNIQKAGIESAAVMAGLKKAVQLMQKDGVEDMQQGLENTAAKIRAAATETQALALATEAFGAKSAPAMARAIRAGVFDLDAAVAALHANTETIAAAHAQTITFSEAWAGMSHRLEIAFRPAAQTITQALRDMLPHIENLAQRAMPYIVAAAETLAEKTKALAAAAAVFDWSGVLHYVNLFIDGLRTVADFVQRNQAHFVTLAKIVLTLVAAFSAVQGAVAIFTAVGAAVALVTNPVYLTVAAVAALVAAAWFLYDNWEDVCQWCREAWEKFTAALGDLWRAFADDFPATARLLEDIWNATAAALSAVLDALTKEFTAEMRVTANEMKGLWEGMKAAAEIIGPLIVTSWNVTFAAIRTAVEVLSTYTVALFQSWNEVFSAVSDLMKGDWDGFCLHFQNAAQIMKNAFITVWQEIETFIKTVFDHIVSFLQPIVDKIEGMGDFLKNAENTAAGALDSVKNTASGAWDSAKKMVGFASGGFTNGPSLCGEAGTEAVISFDPRYRAENRAYLATAAEMLGMTAAAPAAGSVINIGGMTFAPVINGGNAAPQDIITQLRSAMPELVDMLESALAERQSHRYA